MFTSQRLKWALLGAVAVTLVLASPAPATHGTPDWLENGHDTITPAGDNSGVYCNVNEACFGGINDNTGDGSVGVFGEHRAGTGSGAGVVGATNSTSLVATGVLGRVVSTAPGISSAGVRGINNGTSVFGIGVWGSHAGSGTGGYFTSENGIGMWASHEAQTGNSPAVFGDTNSDSANAAGIAGHIESNAAYATGVRGQNTHAMCCGFGVFGEHSGAGIGVYGEALNGFAISGFSPNNWSGYFQGSVRVVGNLQKNSGSFTIDHPLDPENKYLSHSFVESPDMKNVYDGVVKTNANGFATVKLPRYFQALNRDFRYQLTVIGEFAEAIVAKKISGNRFTIRTDKPGVEVSWQVTGIRKDRWANAHRIKVEELKRSSERGKYLNPELYGKPATKSVVLLPGMTKKEVSHR